MILVITTIVKTYISWASQTLPVPQLDCYEGFAQAFRPVPGGGPFGVQW
jgi:hypothetical protein